MSIIHDRAPERVSETTEPSRIARRLRSSIKMYASMDHPLRGEWITLQEAARRTGLHTSDLYRRIEDGDLPAVHVLCIDSADIAEEEDAAFVARSSELIERATGEAVTAERMAEIFGPAEDRIARRRGEKVSS